MAWSAAAVFRIIRKMKGKRNKKSKVDTPSEAILESISDGVSTVDSQWRITTFNWAAEEITGVARRKAIGRRCSKVFRSSMCGVACALQQTLKIGKLLSESPEIFFDRKRLLKKRYSFYIPEEVHGIVVANRKLKLADPDLRDFAATLLALFEIRDAAPSSSRPLFEPACFNNRATRPFPCRGPGRKTGLIKIFFNDFQKLLGVHRFRQKSLRRRDLFS